MKNIKTTFEYCNPSTGSWPTIFNFQFWQGRWGAKKQRPWLGRGALQKIGDAPFPKLPVHGPVLSRVCQETFTPRLKIWTKDLSRT